MSMTKPTSEQVTFLAAGSGATQRTALEKFRDVVSVKDFGAVGDGVTDDTAAIASAIASFASQPSIMLMFPQGQYVISSKLALNKSSVIIGENATLLLSTPTYAFEVNNLDTSNPQFSEFYNLVFKWSGAFGSSISGGIECTSVTNLRISSCIFWGLGKPAIFINTVIVATIDDNWFKEHLNNDAMISCSLNGLRYLVAMKRNFFQFTSPGNLHPNVYLPTAFNPDISENAFEIASRGLYLGQYGSIYGGSISNNFFESCTIGLSLGNNNGDGFFGSFNGLSVRGNVFTSNTTGISIQGSCTQVTIADNSFDGPGTTGIDVASKGYGSLSIHGNHWLNDIDESDRIVGYAYPFGNSSIDATKVIVDRVDSLSGWSEQFDPSGNGTFALAKPMPGVDASSSIELSFSGAPASYYRIQKTITPVDLDDSDFFVVPFYVDDPAKLRNVAVENWFPLGLGPDSSNFWTFRIGNWSDHRTAIIKRGWNIMTFAKSDAVVQVGSPSSWSSIGYVLIGVVPLNLDGSVLPVVRFGGIFGFKLNGTSAFAASQTL